MQQQPNACDAEPEERAERPALDPPAADEEDRQREEDDGRARDRGQQPCPGPPRLRPGSRHHMSRYRRIVAATPTGMPITAPKTSPYARLPAAQPIRAPRTMQAAVNAEEDAAGAGQLEVRARGGLHRARAAYLVTVEFRSPSHDNVRFVTRRRLRPRQRRERGRDLVGAARARGPVRVRVPHARRLSARAAARADRLRGAGGRGRGRAARGRPSRRAFVRRRRLAARGRAEAGARVADGRRAAVLRRRARTSRPWRSSSPRYESFEAAGPARVPRVLPAARRQRDQAPRPAAAGARAGRARRDGGADARPGG